MTTTALLHSYVLQSAVKGTQYSPLFLVGGLCSEAWKDMAMSDQSNEPAVRCEHTDDRCRGRKCFRTPESSMTRKSWRSLMPKWKSVNMTAIWLAASSRGRRS